MKKLLMMMMFAVISGIVNAQPPNVPAEKGSQFGAAVTADNAITVEQLFAILNSKKAGEKKLETKIQGVVTDVCTKEGCWIKVQTPDGKMMVKMKDHKFLVPVALNGKTVVLSGIAEEKVTTVEQLKHYAEDAGKSKAEIDTIKEPKKEVIFNATGVLVV